MFDLRFRERRATTGPFDEAHLLGRKIASTAYGPEGHGGADHANNVV